MTDGTAALNILAEFGLSEAIDPESWHWKVDVRTGWFTHRKGFAEAQHISQIRDALPQEKRLVLDGALREISTLWGNAQNDVLRAAAESIRLLLDRNSSKDNGNSAVATPDTVRSIIESCSTNPAQDAWRQEENRRTVITFCKKIKMSENILRLLALMEGKAVSQNVDEFARARRILQMRVKIAGVETQGVIFNARIRVYTDEGTFGFRVCNRVELLNNLRENKLSGREFKTGWKLPDLLKALPRSQYDKELVRKYGSDESGSPFTSFADDYLGTSEAARGLNVMTQLIRTADAYRTSRRDDTFYTAMQENIIDTTQHAQCKYLFFECYHLVRGLPPEDAYSALRSALDGQYDAVAARIQRPVSIRYWSGSFYKSKDVDKEPFLDLLKKELPIEVGQLTSDEKDVLCHIFVDKEYLKNNPKQLRAAISAAAKYANVQSNAGPFGQGNGNGPYYGYEVLLLYHPKTPTSKSGFGGPVPSPDASAEKYLLGVVIITPLRNITEEIVKEATDPSLPLRVPLFDRKGKLIWPKNLDDI